MGQDDQWQPALLSEQAPVPTNVVLAGNTLTWDDSSYALLWAVCKDGAVVAFTAEPTYTITVSGTYTVRAANEMGGLSKPSDAVTADATGITDVIPAQKKNAADYYNISGMRVAKTKNTETKGKTDTLGLKKGVYIVDGKKVVVK